LAKDPSHDEAFEAVALIYAGLGQLKEQRDWILARATHQALAREKRVRAFTVLAGKDRDCLRAVTKTAADRMPEGGNADAAPDKPGQASLELAKECATRGLEMTEKAIRLHPESEAAWSSKADLLLLRAKLAEMEGRRDGKADYAKLAAEAQARVARLQKEKRKKTEALRSY
jgi:hypothetical protein